MKTISGFTAYSHFAARLADFVSIIGAGLFAYWVRFDTLDMMVERYQWMILSATLLGMIVFSYMGIYRSWRGAVRIKLVVRILRAFTVLGATIFAYLYFSKTGEDFSRLWLGLWLIHAFLISVVIRVLAYPLLNQIRRRGRNRKRVALIGDSESCRTVLKRLQIDVSTGFDVSMLRLMDASACEALNVSDCRAFDAELDASPDTDEVWVCLPLSRGPVVETIFDSLRYFTGNIRYIPDMRDFRLINHDVSSVAGLLMLDISCAPMSFASRVIKVLEDRVLSLLILVMIIPLLLVIAIGVKVTSPGPVFYRQERVGLNGVAFMMYKFRTMPADLEKDGISWGGARHKTTTRLGHFLRKTSLDELPQFINVLKGDMSIVGPRPERTVFVQQLKHKIPGYMQKHMVKAGITGWAQVNGWRGDTDLQKRIDYDIWYIENWSLWLDLKIVVLTFFKGVVNKNAY